MTEPKPLAVGDRVRKRAAMVVTELLPGPGTGRPGAQCRWEDSDHSEWYWLTNLERIDPAPPVDELADLLRTASAIEAIRTLTAERDAALAESRGLSAGLAEALGYAEGSVWGDLIDRVYSIANERDAARAELAKAQPLANELLRLRKVISDIQHAVPPGSPLLAGSEVELFSSVDAARKSCEVEP